MSAGSSEIALASPILPGKEEKWRRFLQKLEGSRRDEYDELRRRLGIRRQRVWVIRTPRGETAVSYLECEEPRSIAARLAASTQPFDVWLKEKLSEFHGCDLARFDSGWSPELVFEAGVNKDAASEAGRHDGAS